MIGPAGCDSCQNITSFRTPHNNFKTLPLPSKLQREKRKIKVVSNTRSIVVFRLTFLLLFFRGSFAGNRRRRIPAVSRFKLKSTKHRQQNAPCYVRLFFFRRKSFTFALRQEPITWSLQPLCIFVTAFSQTRLFLVWIYREVGLTRAHRLIKIRAWLISNFTRQYIEEKQQRCNASCDSSSADSCERRRPKLMSPINFMKASHVVWLGVNLREEPLRNWTCNKE